MPNLKEHLAREKETEASREKNVPQEKKRKSPGGADDDEADDDTGEPSSKRGTVTVTTGAAV
jgi:hypothetical protein